MDLREAAYRRIEEDIKLLEHGRATDTSKKIAQCLDAWQTNNGQHNPIRPPRFENLPYYKDVLSFVMDAVHPEPRIKPDGWFERPEYVPPADELLSLTIEPLPPSSPVRTDSYDPKLGLPSSFPQNIPVLTPEEPDEVTLSRKRKIVDAFHAETKNQEQYKDYSRWLRKKEAHDYLKRQHKDRAERIEKEQKLVAKRKEYLCQMQCYTSEMHAYNRYVLLKRFHDLKQEHARNELKLRELFEESQQMYKREQAMPDSYHQQWEQDKRLLTEGVEIAGLRFRLIQYEPGSYLQGDPKHVTYYGSLPTETRMTVDMDRAIRFYRSCEDKEYTWRFSPTRNYGQGFRVWCDYNNTKRMIRGTADPAFCVFEEMQADNKGETTKKKSLEEIDVALQEVETEMEAVKEGKASQEEIDLKEILRKRQTLREAKAELDPEYNADYYEGLPAYTFPSCKLTVEQLARMPSAKRREAAKAVTKKDWESFEKDTGCADARSFPAQAYAYLIQGAKSSVFETE